MNPPVALDPSSVDLPRLRAERLARLQAAMRERRVDVCLLFGPGNVRYATGASIMTVYSLGAFVRCALVAVDREPILFEHAGSAHISRRIVHDVRPFHAFEFFDDPAAGAAGWANEIRDAMHELGADGSRLAVDKLATPAFLALAGLGIELTDVAPVTLDAREVKTEQELRAFEVNAAIGMRMLETAESSIEPGVREQDVLAVMTDTLLRAGGEYLITRAVVSGPNTNPWNLEATDRALEPGDLVFVDTDAFGWEGYFIDVSRTFLCGPAEASAPQLDAYRVAYDQLAAMREHLRPGLTFGEFSELIPPLPERYRAQRYEAMIHGAGLEDEGPSAAYADDPSPPNAERVIKPGMVLCLEAYAGEVGARDGVKLEDQVEVTSEGCRIQVPYPFDAGLLGGAVGPRG